MGAMWGLGWQPLKDFEGVTQLAFGLEALFWVVLGRTRAQGQQDGDHSGSGREVGKVG